MDSFMNNIDYYLIHVFGYTRVVQFEDTFGVVCAFLLGHILTMVFSAFVSQRLVRDRKLNGFSVFKVESQIEGEPDRYRVNPKNTHEYVDIIYGVFWMWLFKKEDATFYNLRRIRVIQFVFVALAIIVSTIGILLSIHVTNYAPQ